MKALSAIVTLTAKVSGAALIAAALFAAGGRLFPPSVPADDIAAVSLLALVEGVLYVLPLRIWLNSNRRVLLYLAATLFVPFLMALAAVQYGLRAPAGSPQVAANLMSAAAAFAASLCPPAALLLAWKRRHHPGPQD